MENKITALSDDELMEVTGGLCQLINPSECSYPTKEECEGSNLSKCYWDKERNKCFGGCM